MIKLEVGKEYRTRNNTKLTFVKHIGLTALFMSRDGREYCLMPDLTGGAHGTDFDLIGPWEEPAKPVDLSKVSSGWKVKFRCGARGKL